MNDTDCLMLRIQYTGSYLELMIIIVYKTLLEILDIFLFLLIMT